MTSQILFREDIGSFINSLPKVFYTVIYALMLFYIYREIVTVNYAYMGYFYYHPDYILLVVNILLIAFISCLLPNYIGKPSDLFVWFFFVIVLIPSLVIPLISISEVDPFLLAVAQFSFVIGFVLIIFISNLNIQISNLPSLEYRTYLFMLLLFFLLITSAIFNDYGFNPTRLFTLQNLAGLYDIRFEQRAASQNASLISLYGTSWLTKIIIPLLFVYSLYRKKYILAFVFFLAQISVFTVSAHKSYIITMLVTFYIYYLVMSDGPVGLKFLKAVVGFCFFSLCIFWLFGNTLLIDVMVRRALIVPGMLSGYFIEYFSLNGLALYSQNFMKAAIENQYTMPPAFVVGQEYFGRAELRANVNAFGDTYGNLGSLGVIFNSILMGLILLLLNIFSIGKQKKVIIPAMCGIAWTFSESSFVTTLVTHGAVFSLILIMLFPRKLSSDD